MLNRLTTRLTVCLLISSALWIGFTPQPAQAATRAWDGGSLIDDTDWFEPDNWSSNTAPGPADLAQIFLAGIGDNPTVVFDINSPANIGGNTATIRELALAESLSILGGTLEITTNLTFGAFDQTPILRLDGGTLKVDGQIIAAGTNPPPGLAPFADFIQPHVQLISGTLTTQAPPITGIDDSITLEKSILEIGPAFAAADTHTFVFTRFSNKLLGELGANQKVVVQGIGGTVGNATFGALTIGSGLVSQGKISLDYNGNAPSIASQPKGSVLILDASGIVNEGTIEAIQTGTSTNAAIREIKGQGPLTNSTGGLIEAKNGLLLKITRLDLNENAIEAGQVASDDHDYRRITYVADGGTIVDDSAVAGKGGVYFQHTDIAVTANQVAPTAIKLAGFANVLTTDNEASTTLVITGSELLPADAAATPSGFIERPDAMSHAVLSIDKNVTNKGTIALDAKDIDDTLPRENDINGNPFGIGSANLDVRTHILTNTGTIDVKLGTLINGVGTVRIIKGKEDKIARVDSNGNPVLDPSTGPDPASQTPFIDTSSSDQGTFVNQGDINVEAGTFVQVTGINLFENFRTDDGDPATIDPPQFAPSWTPIRFEAAGGTTSGSGKVVLLHTQIAITNPVATGESRLHLVGFDNELLTDILGGNTLRILGTEIFPPSPVGPVNFAPPEPPDAFSHAVLTLGQNILNSGKIILDAEDLMSPEPLVNTGDVAGKLGSSNLDLGTSVLTNQGDIEVKLGTILPQGTASAREIRGKEDMVARVDANGAPVIDPATQVPFVDTNSPAQATLVNAVGGNIDVETGTLLKITGRNLFENFRDAGNAPLFAPEWSPIRFRADGGTITGGGKVVLLHSQIEITNAVGGGGELRLNLVGSDNELLTDILTGNTLQILGTELVVGNIEPPDAFGHAVLELRQNTLNAGKIVLNSEDLDTTALLTEIATSNLDLATHILTNTGVIEAKLGSGSLREIRGKEDKTARVSGVDAMGNPIPDIDPSTMLPFVDTNSPAQATLVNAVGGNIDVETGTTLKITGRNLFENFRDAGNAPLFAPEWSPIRFRADGGTITGGGKVVLLHSQIEITNAVGGGGELRLNLVGSDNELLTGILTGNTLRILGTELVAGNVEPPDAFGHAVLELRQNTLNEGKIILDSEDLDPTTLLTEIATSNLDLATHILTNTGVIEAKLGSGSLREIRGKEDKVARVSGVDAMGNPIPDIDPSTMLPFVDTNSPAQATLVNATGGSIDVEAGTTLKITGRNLFEDFRDAGNAPLFAPEWSHIKFDAAGGEITGGGTVLLMHADVEASAAAPSETVVNLVTFDNNLVGNIAANNTLRVLGTETLPDPAPGGFVEPADAFGSGVLTATTNVLNSGKIVLDSEDLDPTAITAGQEVGAAVLDVGITTFTNAGSVEAKLGSGSIREIRGQVNNSGVFGKFVHQGTLSVDAGTQLRISGTNLNDGLVDPINMQPLAPDWRPITYVGDGGGITGGGDVLLMHTIIEFNQANLNPVPTGVETTLNLVTFDNTLATHNPFGSTLRVLGTDSPPLLDASGMPINPGESEDPDQFSNAVLNLSTGFQAFGTGVTLSNFGKIVLDAQDLVATAQDRKVGASLLVLGGFSQTSLSGFGGFAQFDSTFTLVNEAAGEINVLPGPVTDDPTPGARSVRAIGGIGTLINRGTISVDDGNFLTITGINTAGQGNTPNWAPITYKVEGDGTFRKRVGNTDADDVYLIHAKLDIDPNVTQAFTNVASSLANELVSDNPLNSTIRIVGTELVVDPSDPITNPEQADALGHAALSLGQNTSNFGTIVLDSKDIDPAAVKNDIGSANLDLLTHNFTNAGTGVIDIRLGTGNGAGTFREIRGQEDFINQGQVNVEAGTFVLISGRDVRAQPADPPLFDPIHFISDGGTVNGEAYLIHADLSITNPGQPAAATTIRFVGNDNNLLTDVAQNVTLLVQGTGQGNLPPPFPQPATGFGNAALVLLQDFDPNTPPPAGTVTNRGTIILDARDIAGDQLSNFGNVELALSIHKLVNEGVIQANLTQDTNRTITGTNDDGQGNAVFNLVNNGEIRGTSKSNTALEIAVNTQGSGSYSGTINFQQQLILSNTSEISVQLGGTTARTGYEQVNVTQDVVLDGKLVVGLEAGYTPDYGDTFQVLSHNNNRTGQFSEIDGVLPAGTTALALAPIYDYDDGTTVHNGLTLVATLPGDADLDFDVDGSDLTIFLGHFNQSGTWNNGDFNGDGVIDGSDLTIILGHFNQMVSVPSNAPLNLAGAFDLGGEFNSNGGAIPEPGTLAILGALIAAASAGRRRRDIIL